MANVAIGITPVVSQQRFTGEQVGEGFYPRARVSFLAQGVTIVLKGAGDTQSISMAMALPANYAYSAEFALAVFDCPTEIPAAADFSEGALVWINDGRQSTFNYQSSMFSRFTQPSTNNAGSTRSWEPLNMFKGIFWNEQGVGPDAVIAINDEDGTNARAAGTVTILMTFLQFDIEQALDVRSNGPMPTRPL